jgi:hypothetical protein
LEKAKEIEKMEHKTQQSRDDASTIQHLKTLNDELSKLSVVPLPDLPSIKYSHKKVTDSDIDQLIGTYSLTVRYVHVMEIFFSVPPFHFNVVYKSKTGEGLVRGGF